MTFRFLSLSACLVVALSGGCSESGTSSTSGEGVLKEPPSVTPTGAGGDAQKATTKMGGVPVPDAEDRMKKMIPPGKG